MIGYTQVKIYNFSAILEKATNAGNQEQFAYMSDLKRTLDATVRVIAANWISY